MGYFPNQSAICIPTAGHATIITTPNLLSSSKISSYNAAGIKAKKIYLYPWHFFPKHRIKVNGKCKLRYEKKSTTQYRDLERMKSYDFPPPRYVPRSFLDDEYFALYTRPQDRWSVNVVELPLFVSNMIAIDYGNSNTRANAANLVSIVNDVPQLCHDVEM